ncbi:twitching motility protein PilT [Burkholderia cepacia]|uniref:Twitching motility protein PilT n=1 Tax=Burkholderia cepacia TaxID=292 RepID=A0A2S8IV57_BURCE|nr:MULTISPECIES: ATPase, T2SS/T4P/T4SS family [Burkholderia]EKS9883127.1 Flp pilus assembly complex ATPase component TadA [Burkholderia pyrrocinia]EKS9895035.1 Flp pilus assembly complex ATPase component TadA [Burkholderia pyrrocinia]EKS9907458.1 Flp pilus assembly complex ATPase component TadA [Burkholderia pyrrocinia]PQP18664.1 twitching motility protein PilT [Burkholderia cepacia]HDR9505632.1 Flp pilus assembly complex ATPase component TadA [Burkholderia cepacia]
MHSHPSEPRDLTQEILDLVDQRRFFTDLHIEQDRPIMIKTPRGWVETDGGPIMLDEMAPMLDAVDDDWDNRLRDGAIDRQFVLTGCRLRAHVYRTSNGRKTVISIRRLPLAPLPLDKLGLPAYIRSTIETASMGLVLVTGVTGSGKTTTIASLLDHLNRTRNCHIVTIEQPIEYALDSHQSIISQREVPTDTRSFSAGMREVLRERADVIMVGEIRDIETAEAVLQASESGHLVFATMHTGSALTTVTRLLSFFPAEQRERHAASLANALIGVICQSLVPSESGDQLVLASELLFNHNQQISAFLTDPSKIPMLAEFVRRKEDNMSRSLNESLAQLVARNAITARDALRATYNRIELNEMLQQTGLR